MLPFHFYFVLTIVLTSQITQLTAYRDFLVHCQKISRMLSAVSQFYGNLSYLKVLIINQMIYQWIRFITGTDHDFLVCCQKNLNGIHAH